MAPQPPSPQRRHHSGNAGKAGGGGRSGRADVPSRELRSPQRTVGSRSHTGGKAAERARQDRDRRGAADGPSMGRWTPAVAAAAVLAVVVFVGYSGHDPGISDSPTSVAGEVNPTGLTVPESTLPGIAFGPDDGTPKTTLSQPLGRGTSGPEVEAVQRRLHDLGFDPGPIDGQFGGGTQQAIWAFEGLVERKRYDQQSGVLSNELWQIMQKPMLFQPRRPGEPGTTHVEIYLDLQALIVFTDNTPTLLTHISSGSNEQWCELVTYTERDGQPLPEPVQEDICGVSKTPGGVFTFRRMVAGKRVGPLGGMMNPVYFNYGIAVHGADNVPNYPASHGCIRIPQWISDYFQSLVHKGDYVYVWDGVKEPEEQTKDEMLPVFNWKNKNPTTTTSSTTIPELIDTTTTVKSTTTVRTTVPATTVVATTTATTIPTSSSGA